MGPCFRSYLSYKCDQQEKIRDRAKMNKASYRVQRLSGNYFEPCGHCTVAVHHEKRLVPCVFFKVSVDHLFGNVESGKINYFFRRKPAKSLELRIQKSVRNLTK